jgi:penicillin-binding protein 1A
MVDNKNQMVQITTRDGLKIYTTIDSDAIACEEAVFAHMANLQEEVFIQAKTIKKRSFVNITTETDRILKRAMKSSNRWNVLNLLIKLKKL